MVFEFYLTEYGKNLDDAIDKIQDISFDLLKNILEYWIYGIDNVKRKILKNISDIRKLSYIKTTGGKVISERIFKKEYEFLYDIESIRVEIDGLYIEHNDEIHTSLEDALVYQKKLIKFFNELWKELSSKNYDIYNLMNILEGLECV